MRARQSHLLTKYLTELSTSSAPSSRVLQEVTSAWTAYFLKAFSSSLAAPPASDSFEAASSGWAEVQARAQDPKWVEQEKVKNEKFAMYFAAVGSGFDAVEAARKRGEGSLDDAKALVEANKDALGLWLDKQVRPSSLPLHLAAITS